MLPLNVGRDSLIGQLQDYQKIDPKIEFELMNECYHEDVLAGRVDIARLPYKPPTKGLLTWSTWLDYNFLLATPDYLQQHDTPQNPKDLKDHSLILRTRKNYPTYYTLFRRGEERTFVWHDLGFKGDALSYKAAVLADIGIVMDLSFVLCKKEIFAGELVPVLNGWHRAPWDMNIVMNEMNEENGQLVQFAESLTTRRAGHRCFCGLVATRRHSRRSQLRLCAH